MDSGDLAQAVRYEVEQYVPMPATDLYMDYETITANAEGQLDVLMMAAPRAIVDSYLKLFEILNLDVSAVEANMTAVVRGLLHSGDVTGSSLVIDIGSISSDITIYDKFIPLTGSVPVGGEHYTQALMKQLGIKQDQANEIKEKFGVGPSGMHDKVVAASNPNSKPSSKRRGGSSNSTKAGTATSKKSVRWSFPAAAPACPDWPTTSAARSASLSPPPTPGIICKSTSRRPTTPRRRRCTPRLSA